MACSGNIHRFGHFVLLAGVGMALTITGCGGGTKTVTVGSGKSEGAATATTPASPGLEPVKGPLTRARVAACLRSGGADLQDTKSVGDGADAVFAFGPAGSRMGIVIAPNAAVAKELADQLAAQDGYQVRRVPDEPKAVVMFDENAESADELLVGKCVGSAS